MTFPKHMQRITLFKDFFVTNVVLPDCSSHSADFSGRKQIPVFLESFQNAVTRLVAVQHRLDRSANLKKIENDFKL
jgi:hypothetical protein